MSEIPGIPLCLKKDCNPRVYSAPSQSKQEPFARLGWL